MDLMQWIEAHPGMASWVQAVGSIAAIVAAFAIASAGERSKIRSEKQRAQVVVRAVVMLAWKTYDALKNAREEASLARSQNREASTEQVAIAQMLMDSLKNVDPFHFPKPDSVMPFYELKVKFEEAMSHVRELSGDNAYPTIFAPVLLDGALEAASMAIRDLAAVSNV